MPNQLLHKLGADFSSVGRGHSALEAIKKSMNNNRQFLIDLNFSREEMRQELAKQVEVMCFF